MVEVYQILSYPTAFGLVCFQNGPIGDPVYDVCDFPAEIIGCRCEVSLYSGLLCFIKECEYIPSCILTFMPWPAFGE